MKKIAVIEKIHNDGLELLKKNKGYDYELITDISEENLNLTQTKFKQSNYLIRIYS